MAARDAVFKRWIYEVIVIQCLSLSKFSKALAAVIQLPDMRLPCSDFGEMQKAALTDFQNWAFAHCVEPVLTSHYPTTLLYAIWPSNLKSCNGLRA